jgi:NhaC family Na+:H+ antiporter
MTDQPRSPSLVLSLVPVAVVMTILGLAIPLLGASASARLPLIVGSVLVVLIGLKLGYSWKTLQEGMVKGISIGLPSILILLSIGILIGSWLASGVVPLLVTYGLQLLTPEVFLVACCLICAVVSVVTGSSWTTAATIGVALIGVAEGLEVSKAMTAGAIVSGAYFGDKLSPLSDTTNLAAGVAEVPLFEHIRHMLWTTVPSMMIALGGYALLGMRAGGDSNVEDITLLMETIEGNFVLSPVLLVAPLSMIGCLLFRMPALGAILVGGVVGAVLALTVQGESAAKLVGVLENGYEPQTGVPRLDKLLSGGGLESMYGTIGLILCALSFGGLMESTGMLRVIVQAVMRFAINTGRLVLATLASSLGVNLLAADQYLSIILPGRMYKEAYDEAGLEARNLSRCLEDAGTITSPLIPWNTCGATMLGALKVGPHLFAPFAFFNLLCPLVSVLLGFTGWTMHRRPGDSGSGKG